MGTIKFPSRFSCGRSLRIVQSQEETDRQLLQDLNICIFVSGYRLRPRYNKSPCSRAAYRL